jgi:hypothetical protein
VKPGAYLREGSTSLVLLFGRPLLTLQMKIIELKLKLVEEL